MFGREAQSPVLSPRPPLGFTIRPAPPSTCPIGTDPMIYLIDHHLSAVPRHESLEDMTTWVDATRSRRALALRPRRSLGQGSRLFAMPTGCSPIDSVFRLTLPPNLHDTSTFVQCRRAYELHFFAMLLVVALIFFSLAPLTHRPSEPVFRGASIEAFSEPICLYTPASLGPGGLSHCVTTDRAFLLPALPPDCSI
ncbi:unnamed protein product [Protopolystoma xenopodis]|uniref:Uncharacterized protein n=1 Tax=Protopolystoma xenopodis TaxID=117903 RepID=A0A3S5FDU2_9PLAT|nr:unnamed protein product [Protopolystoma xenopodis]